MITATMTTTTTSTTCLFVGGLLAASIISTPVQAITFPNCDTVNGGLCGKFCTTEPVGTERTYEVKGTSNKGESLIVYGTGPFWHHSYVDEVVYFLGMMRLDEVGWVKLTCVPTPSEGFLGGSGQDYSQSRAARKEHVNASLGAFSVVRISFPTPAPKKEKVVPKPDPPKTVRPATAESGKRGYYSDFWSGDRFWVENEGPTNLTVVLMYIAGGLLLFSVCLCVLCLCNDRSNDNYDNTNYVNDSTISRRRNFEPRPPPSIVAATRSRSASPRSRSLTVVSGKKKHHHHHPHKHDSKHHRSPSPRSAWAKDDYSDSDYGYSGSDSSSDYYSYSTDSDRGGGGSRRRDRRCRSAGRRSRR